MKQIPKAATELIDITGSVSFSEREGGKTNVEILAYSGKPITGHWYWGGNGLVIDLAGAKFTKKFYPILEQHDLSRKIGFSAKPLTDNNELRIENVNFLDSEPATEFINFSKQGFPYQASISGRPIRIEELEDGASVEVNGFTFKGPGYIWREWEYRETSVCVFGADDRTKSKAFKEDGEIFEVAVTNLSKQDDTKTEFKEEEKEVMDLKELKEKDPTAYAQFMADAAAASQAMFDAKVEVITGEFSAKIASLTTELGEERAKREKIELIQREKDLKSQAEKIISAKFALSDLPERLFSKVEKLINYSKFVTNDGLDVASFEAAVDAEIADWTSEGITKTIIGASFTEKNPTDDESQSKFEAEDAAWIEKMHKLAGQQPVGNA